MLEENWRTCFKTKKRKKLISKKNQVNNNKGLGFKMVSAMVDFTNQKLRGLAN